MTSSSKFTTRLLKDNPTPLIDRSLFGPRSDDTLHREQKTLFVINLIVKGLWRRSIGFFQNKRKQTDEKGPFIEVDNTRSVLRYLSYKTLSVRENVFTPEQKEWCDVQTTYTQSLTHSDWSNRLLQYIWNVPLFFVYMKYPFYFYKNKNKLYFLSHNH